MLTLARIYGYTAGSAPAVFVDRLYPRGICKEVMAQVWWLKDITPSTELRRWFHQDPEARFDVFCQRYRSELHGSTQQAALQTLRALVAKHPQVVLLTAAKQPERSHLAVLAQLLEKKKEGLL